jgi:hypothetical protein
MKTTARCAAATVLFALLAVAACGDDGGTPPPSGLEVTEAISACGGFLHDGTSPKGPPSPDPTTYCDAERLLWSYDVPAKTLSLLDARILLNCCGDHSIEVAKDGETYVLTEVDDPEGGSTRCKCVCVYDYAADLSPIEPGVLALRIVRRVKEQTPPSVTIWEGSLDLSKGEGQVILEDKPIEGICSAPAP